MNVLELLNNELKDKKWSQDEKIRYLYIRCCQLFYYDNRYALCDIKEHLKEIRNRIIDLEKVDDNRVICTSHTKIVQEVMEQVLGVKCGKIGKGHAWTIINNNGKFINADTTVSSDIVRAKMGMSTNGYYPIEKEHNFEQHLKQIDKNIGYITDEYENHFIQKTKDNLYEEYIKYSGLELSSTYMDDFSIFKLYTIKELFEKYKQLKGFSDCEFCVSYLMRKILDEKTLDSLSTIFLFDDSSEHWNFTNIYSVKLTEQMIYFILEKVDNEFCFYETTLSDARQYVKNMKGLNKKKIIL